MWAHNGIRARQGHEIEASGAASTTEPSGGYEKSTLKVWSSGSSAMGRTISPRVAIPAPCGSVLAPSHNFAIEFRVSVVQCDTLRVERVTPHYSGAVQEQRDRVLCR